MVSTRPYLIRAIYDWAHDNNFTPHLLVDATEPNVIVPAAFIDDGKIILNIASTAVANLQLGDELIHFSARFSGVVHEISVPTSAVRAIYARENGMGLVLPDDGPHENDDTGKSAPEPTGSKSSHLKVIK